MKYNAIDRRDEGVVAEMAFVQARVDEGWTLVAVIVLPVMFSRLENDQLRYYFQRAWAPLERDT